ncbi:MAG: hypothetical protein Q4D60_08945 [Eubacteriales bacterium]|nr:hypothetical protein [Eubacteriales bacterium]
MVQLVYLKENIKYFYQKYGEYLLPAWKLVFSFLALCLIQEMFAYNEAVDNPLAFLAISAVQAFAPMSLLFYTASCVMLLNLWKVSVEICAVLFIFLFISYLLFIRMDSRYAFIVILTPILFYLKLEYFLPVLLGMMVGFGGILPMTSGVFIYFFSSYTKDASALITTTSNLEPGMGMSRIVNLIVIDRRLLVLLVTFGLVAFLSCLLYQMFHENAWLFSILIGNVSMAILLLSGRLIFELDYTIWRVFLESFLAVGLAGVVQFFKGLGDVSRMEKVTFEDEEYIYYVKAVPKIKVTQADRNVMDIISGEEQAEFEMFSEGEDRKKEEAESREKSAVDVDPPPAD